MGNTEIEHAGWTRRGYLPHYDAASAIQHVVFRLAGSLPRKLLDRIQTAPADIRFDVIETALDLGPGPRDLADPRVAQLVADTLAWGEGRLYGLVAWCVMPSHVHVLIEQARGAPLARIVKSWKTFTAREANLILGREGPFWAPDYFDRAMWREGQTDRAVAYIEANPVTAGLCTQPGDWRFSSAWR
jgi:REP element-mobilizing transposase RayT